MSAQDLGKRLLAEVEEIGLDEFLNSLQTFDTSAIEHFGLKPLDSLLVRLAQARSYINKQSPPVIELTSLHPTGGKTHLLYHLSALAVLPHSLGGKQSCVVILDTDGRFSVPRLVQQLHLVASTSTHDPNSLLRELDDTTLEDSLQHIHLFHPQSLSSLLATLESLPSYLFNPTRHPSSPRPLHFLALDSASSFHWQARADETPGFPPLSQESDLPPPATYTHLAAALKATSKTFRTPIIWTSWQRSSGPTRRDPGLLRTFPGSTLSSSTSSFRPSLPAPMAGLVDLRLVVRRAEVRKFPAEIAIEEAGREREARQKVVEQGKFEGFLNEWGVEEEALRELEGEGGKGFEFWITGDGVRFQRRGEEGGEGLREGD